MPLSTVHVFHECLPALGLPQLGLCSYSIPAYFQEANGLRQAIIDLVQLRTKHGINCRSKVTVRKATADVYAATIDDKIAMKIGPGDWSPSQSNLANYTRASSGHQFAVWELC